ncbi:aminoglycoside 3'-phosphotransferase [Herbidospora sp. NBRC 101105]|uniref:aminoglycoside 3'-phosphotransferase n=1 Tax=Herbidospora sp. NBRC 101105 TaxID=3032195 RepID=UPI0024A08374|nr:aminoglycoside 3'-phosphotransferase [Herbidospora sp. NBRC 101105]GLX93943.1 putative phosphotransferase [Herbidospora sp. NBRC 101105]
MTRPPLAAAPTGEVEVPEAVRALAAGATVTPVWRNRLGGLTFHVGDHYVKWAPAGVSGLDLRAEAERLSWASRWVSVPRVVGQGADAQGSWLVTEALPGLSPVDPRRPVPPEVAAAAVGQGLRTLHDTLPVAECPFDWGVSTRLARVTEENRSLPSSPPEIDRLVVCHGDPCVPNTLIGADGSFTGHVDLGSLGVADRWADLAVAAWSMDWNFGPGHDGLVYEAYGVIPDPERVAYYRLLWDLPTL